MIFDLLVIYNQLSNKYNYNFRRSKEVKIVELVVDERVWTILTPINQPIFFRLDFFFKFLALLNQRNPQKIR